MGWRKDDGGKEVYFTWRTPESVMTILVLVLPSADPSFSICKIKDDI